LDDDLETVTRGISFRNLNRHGVGRGHVSINVPATTVLDPDNLDPKAVEAAGKAVIEHHHNGYSDKNPWHRAPDANKCRNDALVAIRAFLDYMLRYDEAK